MKYYEIDPVWSEKLKNYRISNEMTLRNLASLIDVAPSTLYRLERGASKKVSSRVVSNLEKLSGEDFKPFGGNNCDEDLLERIRVLQRENRKLRDYISCMWMKESVEEALTGEKPSFTKADAVEEYIPYSEYEKWLIRTFGLRLGEFK